jgi:hypothetical protein
MRTGVASRLGKLAGSGQCVCGEIKIQLSQNLRKGHHKCRCRSGNSRKTQTIGLSMTQGRTTRLLGCAVALILRSAFGRKFVRPISS